MQTLRSLNLWCLNCVFIYFPHREFALHMFTVRVPEAAVYISLAVFIEQKNTTCLCFTKVHTRGIMCITVPSTSHCLTYSNIQPFQNIIQTYDSYMTQLRMTAFFVFNKTRVSVHVFDIRYIGNSCLCLWNWGTYSAASHWLETQRESKIQILNRGFEIKSVSFYQFLPLQWKT